MALKKMIFSTFASMFRAHCGLIVKKCCYCYSFCFAITAVAIVSSATAPVDTTYGIWCFFVTASCANGAFRLNIGVVLEKQYLREWQKLFHILFVLVFFLLISR